MVDNCVKVLSVARTVKKVTSIGDKMAGKVLRNCSRLLQKSAALQKTRFVQNLQCTDPYKGPKPTELS